MLDNGLLAEGGHMISILSKYKVWNFNSTIKQILRVVLK